MKLLKLLRLLQKLLLTFFPDLFYLSIHLLFRVQLDYTPNFAFLWPLQHFFKFVVHGPTDGPTDIPTDRRTDIRTNRHTDRHGQL